MNAKRMNILRINTNVKNYPKMHIEMKKLALHVMTVMMKYMTAKQFLVKRGMFALKRNMQLM